MFVVLIRSNTKPLEHSPRPLICEYTNNFKPYCHTIESLSPHERSQTGQEWSLRFSEEHVYLIAKPSVDPTSFYLDILNKSVYFSLKLLR